LSWLRLPRNLHADFYLRHKLVLVSYSSKILMSERVGYLWLHLLLFFFPLTSSIGGVDLRSWSRRDFMLLLLGWDQTCHSSVFMWQEICWT
jgi:hypothetical protein